MNKTFYYTYLIYLTNPNSSLYGKIYFGQHRTKNLLDGYIGSGKLLKRYLKKYPNDYYRKILNFYSSLDELNNAEYELIHPHLGKEYCVNIREGGNVNFFEISKPFSEEHLMKISESIKKLWQNPEYRAKCEYAQKVRTKYASGYTASDETKRKQSERKKENPTKYWLGKSLPEYMRKEISDKQKGRKQSPEEIANRSKSLKGKNKGKHKVWDNKELNIYHMEY